jgi:hypothetical protein
MEKLGKIVMGMWWDVDMPWKGRCFGVEKGSWKVCPETIPRVVPRSSTD